VISFKGTEVKPRFIPAKGDPNETMRIVLDPLLHGTRGADGEVLAINRGALLPGTKLVVNFFDGGERDRVEVSLDGQPYVTMQNVLRTDPFMERQYAKYRGTDDAFSRPQPSSHIWEHALNDLGPGVHTARVRARDEFGQRSESTFSFEVE
jgi:hypothetical protein